MGAASLAAIVFHLSVIIHEKMIRNGRLLSDSGSQTANMAPLVEQRVIVGVEWTAGGEVSNAFQLTLTFILLQFQFYSFYR